MSRRAWGFTLIELMVVMAIVATLLTIVTPSYFTHLERSREAALRETLAVTRDAIDKFHGDHDRYPGSLQELVDRRYLRSLPLDPITERRDSWVLLAPPTDSPAGEAEGGALSSGVWDLHSGAQQEGKDYGQW
ncbi:MAG: type II secretion system protein G [Comamonadaceae bacterium]|nr:type II secretion system protein G [Comamonadaceae bacterium]